MSHRVRIQPSLSTAFKDAEKLLGKQTVRRLMTKEGGRLMRPERLANIERGTAKLQPWEKTRLIQITKNRNALSRLQESSEERGPLYSSRKRKLATSTKKRAVDKALKDWMLHGKQAGIDYQSQSVRKKKQQQKAIHALKFLGVDFDLSDAPDVYVNKN